MSKLLVLDGSNIAFRSYFVHAANKENANVDSETMAGIAFHTLLNVIKSYSNKHKPDQIFLCMDRPNFRKTYTKSPVCVSGRIYKDRRAETRSETDQERYDKFKEFLQKFEVFIKENTTINVLAADGLEGDDLMAVVAHEMHDKHEITIVSSDKDMIQLLRYDTVKLVDPAKYKRNLDEWNGDADLFLFFKFIRGEMAKSGDNIQSAFPRCRKTRIVKAWDDAYEMENLLNETFVVNDKTFLVKDLINENRLLMDLNAQPDNIKQLMKDTLADEMNRSKQFDFMKFLKFLKEFNLKKISEQAEQYATVLSTNVPLVDTDFKRKDTQKVQNLMGL